MKIEEKKYLKKEPIQLKDQYEKLFQNLHQKRLAFDERISQHMAKKMGVRCADQKVFKLMSVYLEMYLDEILTSINHKNKKEIDNITRKY